MKTIIENSMLLSENDENNSEMLTAFNEVVQICTLSKNLDELKLKMGYLSHRVKYYFVYGFGADHMWLKQKKDMENRILLVVDEK